MTNNEENKNPSPCSQVMGQGEFEIVEVGTKGTRGITQITPNDWWFKLPSGSYKIVVVPLDAPTPQTRAADD